LFSGVSQTIQTMFTEVRQRFTAPIEAIHDKSEGVTPSRRPQDTGKGMRRLTSSTR